MHSVVEEGTGGRAKVTGYEVGGKSGTSEPPQDHKENGYTASFVAISPIENTRVVCLVMLFNLTEAQEHQGGTVCGPVAGQILTEVLPLISGNATNGDTQPNSTNNNNNKSVVNVKGMTVESAKAKLEESGFNVSYNVEDISSSVVVDQMPKAGAYLGTGSSIYLYANQDEERQKVVVPNVETKSLNDAINELRTARIECYVRWFWNCYCSKYKCWNRSRDWNSCNNYC